MIVWGFPKWGPCPVIVSICFRSNDLVEATTVFYFGNFNIFSYSPVVFFSEVEAWNLHFEFSKFGCLKMERTPKLPVLRGIMMTKQWILRVLFF